jgi:hypothetical protein
MTTAGITAHTATDHTATARATSTSPGAAFSNLVSTALDYAAVKASHRTSGGGAKQRATVKGVQAGLQGKNPVLAAVKGVWTGGTAMVKAAVVTALVALLLLALLSPVLLLVFLLSALIVVAVAKARSAKR